MSDSVPQAGTAHHGLKWSWSTAMASQVRPPASSEPALTFEDVSAPGETRTPNLLIRSQMLYPLSYGRVAASDRRSPYRQPRGGSKSQASAW